MARVTLAKEGSPSRSFDKLRMGIYYRRSMKYHCPSCKLNTEDDLAPKDMISTPLCIFCSTKHTEKELINWQMDHLKDIDEKFFPIVIRNFYRYVERQLKNLYIIHEDKNSTFDQKPKC